MSLSNLSEMDPKAVRLFFLKSSKKGFPLTDDEFLYHLNEFSLETMLVLLKNGFPTIIDGDLFFLKSLHQLGPDLPDPSLLHWLDFTLDLSNRLRVNLNHINTSTRETILHEAVRDNNLALTQKILTHRVDPNIESDDGKTPIALALELYTDTRDKNYLFIIRHLHRYGAELNYSRVPPEVQKELNAGEKLPPYYYPSTTEYLALDRIEDMVLTLLKNPELISQMNPSDVNIKELTEGIKNERARVYKSVTWPLFVNSSIEPTYFPEEDDRITASSPTTYQEVYEKAAAGLPDLKEIHVPNYSKQESFPPLYDASIPQIDLELAVTTRPLPGRPIAASSNPKLPNFL